VTFHTEKKPEEVVEKNEGLESKKWEVKLDGVYVTMLVSGALRYSDINGFLYSGEQNLEENSRSDR
jgi:hypothetical protein